MKVSELGEFGLINLLAEITGASQCTVRQKLLIGIGDDAAVWHNRSTVQLATVDSLIEGVHFKLDTTGWRELGWKALAVSLSDIAAMGGVPQYALVSLALPGETMVEDVADLYRGIAELADRFGVAIAGGDSSNAPLVVINTTVFGETAGRNEDILTRSAAIAGDKIAVSGYLGGATGGLAMLSNNMDLNKKDSAALRQAFLRPQPRLNEGQMLLQQGVKAAIDISDGLIADLGHICQASGVGARIEVEHVPLHPALKASFGNKALDMALAGGEDYELLFTATEEVIKKAAKKTACPLTLIGEITNNTGKIELIDASGKPYKPAASGWQHFKQ
ncbi:thiamine-phosphate kinase [Chloroflexota bacterium]